MDANAYTPEEIATYVKQVTHFAQAPTFLLLRRMIATHARDSGRDSDYIARAEQLNADLREVCSANAGHAAAIPLSRKDSKHSAGMKSLNVWLSVGPRDFKPAVSVPSDEFATTVYTHYDYLKRVAVAYWKQFQTDHPELYGRVCEFLGTTYADLIIDSDNLTSMYLDKEFPERIVITVAYVDKDGKFYAKKQS